MSILQGFISKKIEKTFPFTILFDIVEVYKYMCMLHVDFKKDNFENA